jgi:hypothetical protein
MVLSKDKVIDTVNNLPANFSLDELIDRLILVEEIQEGLRQSENDEVVSNKDVKEQLNKWLK